MEEPYNVELGRKTIRTIRRDSMQYIFQMNILSFLACITIQQRVFKDKVNLETRRSFKFILVIVEAILAIDTTSLLIQYNVIPGSFAIQMLLMSLYFFLQTLFAFETMIYCLEFREKKVINITWHSTIPLLISAVSIIINSIKPFAFNIIENEKYERLTSIGFLCIIIWPVLYIFIGTGVLLKDFFNGTWDETRRENDIHIITFAAFGVVSAFFSFFFKRFMLWPFVSMDLVYLYINVLSKNNKKLDILAFKDTLTGIGNATAYASNRKHIVEEIDEGFAEFALVVMDVNGLKQINDNFGHKAGDVLIKSAAMFICHLFRKSPVYRIGGDEFIAILKKDDYNNREELIAEFDEKLENKMIDVGNNVIKLSIARGITVYEKGMTYQEVFNKADEKMYTNKAYIKGINSNPHKAHKK